MSNVADQVRELIYGRWRSQTLYAGAELGVFDHLDRVKAKKAETLAAELRVDPALLYRLLRAQAAIGLLEEDISRGFVLTEAGDLLRSDHPHFAEGLGTTCGGTTTLRLVEAPGGYDPRRKAECVRPRIRSDGLRIRAS